jgi:YHS domain-containing protein
MRRNLTTAPAVLFAAVVLTAAIGQTWAQSGSRTYPRRVPPKVEKKAPLGLKGFCPVCIVELRKWVKGSPAHEVLYDGHRYRFPGDKQKKMFLAQPVKYTPVLGGDCVVCYAKTGERRPGNLNYSAVHDGRLYLFASGEQRKMFLADPKAYADVDLALEGNCAVCLVEMKHKTPGKAEFGVIHNGLRYLFPSAKMREMFLKDPKKYQLRTAEKKPPAAGSTNR